MRPKAIVFLGPTLPLDRAKTILEVSYWPPARCGDVYRACTLGPDAILIIDGVFESAAAVFHKEVLWALNQGVRVYGSSSLGALRAAELDVFGMIGVGAVYWSYRTGELERDDAVAVQHCPAELGYAPLTVALIDAHATFRRAECEGVISSDVGARLAQIASNIFYKDRTYQRIIEDASNAACDPASLARLKSWLPSGAYSQKSADALQALHRLRTDLAEGNLPEPPAPFEFQRTSMWEVLRAQIDKEVPPEIRRIVEQSWGDPGTPDSFKALAREALAYVLARKASGSRGGVPADDEMLAVAAHRYRRDRGLLSDDDVRRWLSETGFDDEEYLQLVQDEHIVGVTAHRFARETYLKVWELMRARGYLHFE
jgi:hypothetical protein